MANILTSVVIAALISGIITLLIALFGPKIREWFKLREIYLVPFRKWCSNFYGELNEFNTRYLERDFSDISDLQLICDYRELHETLSYAPRWVGKIGKKEKDSPIRDNLLKLMEIVDIFWHHLEDKYSQELPSTDKVKLFEAHIKALLNDERQEIAQKLREHLLAQKKKYKSFNILDILKYLEKRIP